MPLGEHQRIGEPPAKNFSFLTRKLTSQVLPILLLHYYLHPCKNSPGGTIRCLPSLYVLHSTLFTSLRLSGNNHQKYMLKFMLIYFLFNASNIPYSYLDTHK